MDEFQRIFEIIESRSGIRVNETHRNYVIDAVKKRSNFKTPDEYATLLEQDEKECSALIDLTAINETYFFREESHFDFLKENILPSYIGKPIMLWSAACSSGEESVSLYTLAKSLGCKPIIFATDIDSETLSEMKKFKWHGTSVRTDGEKYKSILEKFGTLEDGYWTLKNSEIINFHVSKFNLVSNETLPMPYGTVDIIFLRNVFIYFSKENQKTVLKRMSEALRPGGLLFLSVNEIASIDGFDDIPLEKEHSGSVYYFRRLTDLEMINRGKQKSSLRYGNINAQISSLAGRDSTRLASLPQTAKSKIQPIPQSLKTTADTNQIEANQKTIPQKPDSVEEIAEKCLKLISEKNYKAAEEMIEKSNFRSQEIEYKYYLFGRLYNETGDTKNEQAVLNKAVIANPKFWPGWFSLGVLYERTKQNSKKQDSFKKCRTILEKCINENKTEYNFIVESFDLSYFVKLCDYYLVSD